MLRRLIRPLLPARAIKLIKSVRTTISPQKTYHDYSIDKLEHYRCVQGTRLLVVGANTGVDCKRFIDRGAQEVHGLDVIEDVGSEYTHPRVTYHRQSIESCNLPSDYFDIAFAVATFEHVPDIYAGWSEMVRVTKPRGIIFSVASPLWQSMYGHHMGCFDVHPWIHLAFDRSGIEEYCVKHDINGERGHSLTAILDYMLNPSFFNQRPASDYLAATQRLAMVEMHENTFARNDSRLLENPLAVLAMERGYLPDNMLR
jgi:SAM-dependent methyltransferase